MFITKEKYHSDIIKAYTRGLEQGFEFARMLKQNHESNSQEFPWSFNSSAITQSDKSLPLSQQLIDIARNIFDIPRNIDDDLE